jgi:hypothetical protein
MAWTETTSLSFTARHEAAQSDAAMSVLEALESFRSRLEGLFPLLPEDVTVVLHDSPLQLALAQPYLPIARRISAPAGRRYMTGWFSTREVHTFSPDALRKLAAGPDSLKALLLAPQRAYMLLVVGCNSSLLPPPFRPSTFIRYLRLAWIPEGAAQYFSGQLQHLRPALARRLRGRPPSLPPSGRDAALVGGSIFDLLAKERGAEACVRLACLEQPVQGEELLESVFGQSLAQLEGRWRSHLADLATPRSPTTS